MLLGLQKQWAPRIRSQCSEQISIHWQTELDLDQCSKFTKISNLQYWVIVSEFVYRRQNLMHDMVHGLDNLGTPTQFTWHSVANSQQKKYHPHFHLHVEGSEDYKSDWYTNFTLWKSDTTFAL